MVALAMRISDSATLLPVRLICTSTWAPSCWIRTWPGALKAFVLMKPGKEATATDIINFTRERIAGFKTPKSVDFLEALPRNPSGKILRRNLRDPYWAGKDRQVN